MNFIAVKFLFESMKNDSFYNVLKCHFKNGLKLNFHARQFGKGLNI